MANKLDYAKAQEIRRLAAQKCPTCKCRPSTRTLARMFNVSQKTICAVLAGEVWKTENPIGGNKIGWNRGARKAAPSTTGYVVFGGGERDKVSTDR